MYPFPSPFPGPQHYRHLSILIQRDSAPHLSLMSHDIAAHHKTLPGPSPPYLHTEILVAAKDWERGYNLFQGLLICNIPLSYLQATNIRVKVSHTCLSSLHCMSLEWSSLPPLLHPLSCSPELGSAPGWLCVPMFADPCHHWPAHTHTGTAVHYVIMTSQDTPVVYKIIIQHFKILHIQISFPASGMRLGTRLGMRLKENLIHISSYGYTKAIPTELTLMSTCLALSKLSDNFCSLLTSSAENTVSNLTFVPWN